MSSIASGTTSTTALVYTADTTGNLVLQTNGTTTAVTIDTNQNVGIGTSSSLTKLSVAGSESSYSSRVNISPGDNQNRLMTITSAAVSCDAPASGAGLLQKIFFGPAEGYMTFSTANTERMRIDSSGNLGLGVTPASWYTGSGYKVLQINSSSIFADTSEYRLQFMANMYTNSSGTLTYTSSGYANFMQMRQGGFNFFTNSTSGTAGNAVTTYTQAMTLDNAGHLSLNTTQIYGFLTVASDIYAVKTALVLQNTSSTNSGAFVQFVNSSVQQAGSISQTGSTSVNYGSGSDYRLKENVQPMSNALAKVNQLNPVTFDWIADKTNGQGFIAHELQAIVPDCVVGKKDAVDAEGNPKYQMVDQSKLVAILTKAIQELSAQVTTLQSQVAALKA